MSLATAQVTPPTGVAVDSQFALTDSRANAATYNILVDFSGAGETFHGALQNYQINSDTAYANFRYLGGSIGWIVSK